MDQQYKFWEICTIAGATNSLIFLSFFSFWKNTVSHKSEYNGTVHYYKILLVYLLVNPDNCKSMVQLKYQRSLASQKFSLIIKLAKTWQSWWFKLARTYFPSALWALHYSTMHWCYYFRNVQYRTTNDPLEDSLQSVHLAHWVHDGDNNLEWWKKKKNNKFSPYIIFFILKSIRSRLVSKS